VVDHAVAAGASALVLTGDTPYVSRKARQGRLSSLREDEYLVNLGQHLPAGADPDVDLDQSPDVTETEIGRLAELSGLPVLVKGVLRADDAGRCVDAGAAGLIVSTHGGRQLDRAVPSAAALPAVVASAGGVPVLVDGGIRSGHDVLVALGLGASAVLVGRPFAWALAAGGADGVRSLAAAFADEFAHVLALAGCRDVASISPDLVVRQR
jgi:4-hydroxymandelate oxidase